MSIYDKPVAQLFKDMVEDLGIVQGQVLTRQQVMSWFKAKYPKIKDGTISCHLLRLSTNAPSRVHYNVHSSGQDDLLFQIDRQRFRLYDPQNDPPPIYPGRDAEPDDVSTNELQQFAYEKDLQNFLAKNLQLVEPGLRLYEDEDINGLEFPVGSRYIDILAVDKDKNYVVIELKVSRGYDRVVGQLLRYMAWIRKKQADEGQAVRGIIIAREISTDLVLACSEIKGVGLFEYGLSVTLKEIKAK